MKKMLFSDNMSIKDSDGKIVISVRDGVQEYAGIEIGMQPYEKSFKIYRSPETIRTINKDMVGIPITDGHVDLEEIPEDKIIGYIDSSEIVKYRNNDLDSSVAIKNKVKLSDNMIQLLNSKNQLSLGYFAETENHDLYDFEQVNIVPHHLAIVENGRCGKVCKFRDERKNMTKEEQEAEAKKAEEAKKTEETKTEIKDSEVDETKDADVPVNLQRIAEVMKDLPEAIKLMSTDELKDLIPMLETVISTARAATPNGQEAVEGTEMENKDSEIEEEIDDEGKAIDKEVKDEEEEKKDNFKDSTEFKDAVTIVAGQRVDAILKAKNFLDEGYDFTGDTVTIMRDALATQTSDEFKDNEVGVAFKMLKKFKDYSQFADSKGECEIEKMKEKEI